MSVLPPSTCGTRLTCMQEELMEADLHAIVRPAIVLV
jgi:hypothetical protein